MFSFTNVKKKNIYPIVIAAFLGWLAFYFLYAYLLNPSYDAWLLTAGPDQVQHYLGWLMYRQADWSWPLGLANNYAYPGGVAVTYTDSIPLLAIFFKLFSSILPFHFQYTGLWIMLCFVLQAVFSYLLLNNFLKNKLLSLLGSLFFILSPVMLFRLGGHFALGGHWLILAALWLCLTKEKLSKFWWPVLLVLSLLVHPYLLFMVFFLMLYQALNFFINKKISLQKFFSFIFINSIIVVFWAWAFALFQSDQSMAPGYGDFSLNLNALFNPMGWSRILPDQNIIAYQAEGFSYLGLGLLFLLFCSVIIFVFQKEKIFFIKKYYLLIIFSLLLTFLALSHVVAWGDHVLFTIPWPDYVLDNFFGLFRSSGRFFWPVYYLLILVSILLVNRLAHRWAVFVLVLALILQIYDLTPKLQSRSQEYQNKYFLAPANSNFIDYFSAYDHLSFVPVISHKYFSFLSFQAAKHGLTINDGYFARPPKNLEKNKAEEIINLNQGGLDSRTIYVFSRDADQFLKNINSQYHLIINFDNNIMLFPYFLQ